MVSISLISLMICLFDMSTYEYFSHDYNARANIKLKKLIFKHGMLGYGTFWSIIEDLYNNANALRLDYECIAYDLRVDCELIKSIIKDFDLFTFDGDYFGSIGVQERLDQRAAKSKKAADSAKKRWDNSERNANALRTQSEGNAIKERKGKKKKESIESKESIRTVLKDSSFDNDLLFQNWDRWKEYKKKQHSFEYKTLDTETTGLRELWKFSGGSVDIAIKIIDQSIANGWKGLFELKNTGNGTTQQTTTRLGENDHTGKQYKL